MRIPSTAFILGVALLCSAVEAQSGPVVLRGPGAEGCPEGEQLGARIAAIRHEAEAPASAAYEVSFSHSGSEYAAAVRRIDDPSGVRTLTTQGESCAALAEATAMTILLLLDSEPQPERSPSPPNLSPPSPTPPVTTTREVAPPVPAGSEGPTAPHEAGLRGTLAIGGGVLVGALRPAMPTFETELGLLWRALRAGLGVLWTVPANVEFGPGTLHEASFAGTARVSCAALTRGPLRLELGSGLIAGVADVQARGYTRNQHEREPWLALPLGLSFGYWQRHVGVELVGSALLPLIRHDFSIQGLGPAYRSLPVWPWISLRVTGIWP
ncbi:MAG: hypothetical protein QM778_38595 [Myxococcales bacterium]